MKNKNKLHTPQADTYEALSEKPVSIYEGAGKDPKHGHELYKESLKYKPIEEVESDLINDTDRLVCALDGSVAEGDNFLEGERRFDTPVDGAIYLDKSARPVRALVHELWKDMSDKPEPVASFLNIDKEKWLYALGYTPSDFKNRYLPASKLTIDAIDPVYLKVQTARIRSLYLNDTDMQHAERQIEAVDAGEQSPDTLDTLWEMPTKLDDKHVAIVDEVKSSGATLTLADQLLQRALPSTRFEPVFFSTPRTITYSFYDQAEDEMYTKIGDSEKPAWYHSGRSEGRGGIEDTNPEYSQTSPHIMQRLGKYVLSTPYSTEHETPDTLGRSFRNDFKMLARRFREGKIQNYIPATDDVAQYKQRIEKYYGMKFKDWRDKRQRGETMRGAEQ